MEETEEGTAPKKLFRRVRRDATSWTAGLGTVASWAAMGAKAEANSGS